jgi:hypothetical protein
LVEVLKQGQYVPLPVEQQIVQIYAATNGFWDDVPVGEVAAFSDELLEHMNVSHSGLLSEIAEKKEIGDELATKLKKAIGDFKESRAAVSVVRSTLKRSDASKTCSPETHFSGIFTQFPASELPGCIFQRAVRRVGNKDGN